MKKQHQNTVAVPPKNGDNSENQSKLVRRRSRPRVADGDTPPAGVRSAAEARAKSRLDPEHHVRFEVVPVADLRPSGKRLRVHDKEGFDQLRANIREHGFLGAILAARNGTIIAGERRYKAAIEEGYTRLPVLYADQLDELQQRKVRIADNKLAESSTWDIEALRIELGELLLIEPELRIDALGFSIPEFDVALGLDGNTADDDETDSLVAPSQPGQEVSRRGDRYRIGPHVIVCGDARSRRLYRGLLGRERVALILTDPPWNLRIRGIVSGNGKVVHDEFAMASGEMSRDEYLAFTLAWMRQAIAVSKPGSLLYAAINAISLHVLEEAARTLGLEHITTCVWDKGVGGMGSFYRSQTEFYPVWRIPGARHRNNIQLGRHGRYRTNVWSFPGLNTVSKDRAELLAMHPTVKPVAMLKEAILDSTARGDIVLDPFGGSGSTLIAAHETGRIARLIECEPRYADCIVKRAEAALGEEAVHAASGLAFSDLARKRRAGDDI